MCKGEGDQMNYKYEEVGKVLNYKVGEEMQEVMAYEGGEKKRIPTSMHRLLSKDSLSYVCLYKEGKGYKGYVVEEEEQEKSQSVSDIFEISTGEVVRAEDCLNTKSLEALARAGFNQYIPNYTEAVRDLLKRYIQKEVKGGEESSEQVLKYVASLQVLLPVNVTLTGLYVRGIKEVESLVEVIRLMKLAQEWGKEG